MPSGQLERILQISETMLRLSDQQQWEQIAVLEAERHCIIRNYFAKSSDCADDVVVSIRKILELDNQLLLRSRQARNEVARARQGLAHGRRAAQAYRTHRRAD